ncbi:MAG: hypothetical protein GC156_16080 [Actinomycetales bacterium]|nr:hypothetical protein [Actinomycetales bacterium]
MRRDAHRQERGAVAVLTAILVVVLLVLAAIAVDVARWYVEAQRVQNVADSAALAGVVSMPDFDKADARALQVASENGYPVSSKVTVTPLSIPDHPTQLSVTVSSTIHNSFGAIFGNPESTIVRSATADYTGAALMGSPCNLLGNEPPSTDAAALPTGTVLPAVPPGYATCLTSQGFWVNIAGPATNKQNGDRYATRTNCSNDTYGCTGGVNDEYPVPDRDNPGATVPSKGYYFNVRVNEDAVGHDITLQLYDPEFAYTGDYCEELSGATAVSVNVNYVSRTSNVVTLTTDQPHGFSVGDSVAVNVSGNTYDGTFTITAVPSPTTFRYTKSGSNSSGSTSGTATVSKTIQEAANPYVPASSPADVRYAADTRTSADAKIYCPGDQILSNGNHLVTSFVLLEQTDSGDPELANVQADVNGVQCSRQYGSLRVSPSNPSSSVPTWAELTQSSASYNPSLASMFHQWVDFCTFRPTRKGDYYLQVRTNVPQVGNAIDGQGLVTNGQQSGVNRIVDPTTYDETGSGHNRFAIRAYVPDGDSAAAQVSVSGWERMPIYVNAQNSTANFNLVQVHPNSAGKFFEFQAFDNGDASCGGSGCWVQVLLPLDAVSSEAGVPLTMGTCTGTRKTASTTVDQGTLTDCRVEISGNQGALETIRVSIPTNYYCNETSPGGCWYRVRLTYPGAVSDTTTWDARIQGDVVRLVK